MIARDLAHLHGDTLELARLGNNLNKLTGLTEKGQIVPGLNDFTSAGTRLGLREDDALFQPARDAHRLAARRPRLPDRARLHLQQLDEQQGPRARTGQGGLEAGLAGRTSRSDSRIATAAATARGTRRTARRLQPDRARRLRTASASSTASRLIETPMPRTCFVWHCCRPVRRVGIAGLAQGRGNHGQPASERAVEPDDVLRHQQRIGQRRQPRRPRRRRCALPEPGRRRRRPARRGARISARRAARSAGGERPRPHRQGSLVPLQGRLLDYLGPPTQPPHRPVRAARRHAGRGAARQQPDSSSPRSPRRARSSTASATRCRPSRHPHRLAARRACLS